MGMQLSAPPTLLLVDMILLLIFPQNVAAPKDHENEHDQEGKLYGTFGVSHDRDFIDGIGYFFAQPPAPDVARKQHFRGGS